jgi:hypothetical protein
MAPPVHFGRRFFSAWSTKAHFQGSMPVKWYELAHLDSLCL